MPWPTASASIWAAFRGEIHRLRARPADAPRDRPQAACCRSPREDGFGIRQHRNGQARRGGGKWHLAGARNHRSPRSLLRVAACHRLGWRGLWRPLGALVRRSARVSPALPRIFAAAGKYRSFRIRRIGPARAIRFTFAMKQFCMAAACAAAVLTTPCSSWRTAAVSMFPVGWTATGAVKGFEPKADRESMHPG